MAANSRYRGLVILVLTVILLSIGAPVVDALHLPPTDPSEAAAPGTETLTTLRQTVIPPRDPVDLARRLLNVTTVPTAIPAKDYQVGDVEQFIASNLDRVESFTVAAQLWYKTPHVYMWFQQGFRPNLGAVKSAADTFETTIYPTVRKFFGSEPSPGMDGDPHLYILHLRGVGGLIAGYFGSDSQYPRVVSPDSNEHEIFFISLDVFHDDIGSPPYLSTLAHEFQHMVRHNIDPNEDGWLNEGLSVLSELLSGYPDVSFAEEFLATPDTQLNTWSPENGANAPHYGAAFLFATYFWQRFGDDALRMLSESRTNGLAAIADTLRRLNAIDPVTGKPITVEDLFADWTMANLLQNPKVGDGRFAYPRIPRKLRPPQVRPVTVTPTVQSLLATQWGTQYLDISEKGRYSLRLQCEPTVKVAPTDARSGRWMWWSNRGDLGDTRLTRAFDLTGVSKATLSFWLWYAIERNWDYGYVAVSTDGGATWKVLSTEESVAAGGPNNPYGAAYTSYSGGGTFDESAAWARQTADLTPYAGQKILVRFEYLTDDAVNEPGMLIDDISIPEINYSTDVESGHDGWIAEGWARIDNVLPQRYLVQMAEYGSTPRVFRLLGPDSGTTGNWTLDISGGVSRLTIAVSGLTEFTTEPGFCEYQLTRVDKS
jgi:immune inhibitor A